MRKASLNSYYASEVEIQASAEKFKLFIVIKRVGQTLVFGDPNHRKIYFVHKNSFDNGHFDLLIPNNEASCASLPKNDVPTMEQRVTEVKVRPCMSEVSPKVQASRKEKNAVSYTHLTLPTNREV